MTKIFAHRGWSGHFLENTEEAFSNLRRIPVDGVELDVQATKDHQLVVFHDDHLDRLSPVQGLLSSYTWAELEDLVLRDGDRFGKILPFKDFLSWATKNDYLLNVELKVHSRTPRSLVTQVLGAIEDSGLDQARFILSSFDWNFVDALGQYETDLEKAYLLEDSPQARQMNRADLFKRMKDQGINYFHPDHKLLDAGWVQAAKDAGVLINTWTVNTEADYQALAAYDLYGLITNYPERFIPGDYGLE